jgi:hypothetical protein
MGREPASKHCRRQFTAPSLYLAHLAPPTAMRQYTVRGGGVAATLEGWVIAATLGQ